MNDLIRRRDVIAWLKNNGYPELTETFMDQELFPPVKQRERSTTKAKGNWDNYVDPEKTFQEQQERGKWGIYG